ncbi:Putative uncharacterized protein [Taphrina deformans PYCC 5710]|uniref:LYR motif-containing protein Cup1-like N-terminal domain-containing protein n=1 Tax=Taphrina deformans (strain PYCC 5710 / ATCC 11124 / CBS 356.35 / IMI 108563 / JCM 9778 / NBRC 8474) TaxID=1097556 RepID=R4X9R9_TAPDE|nr:Putative uncharacterized protein [Taphrina deformans PYCC 5710]|eukprot:CCG82212.1 Putative uncharacterized protein [Taphrina deformans PYCC 5710]
MVRLRYVAHARIEDVQRIARLKTNAKKCLITLQKANLGDQKALVKVLETAYGQRGRLRHEYLGLITSELVPPAPELIPGKSRSRPPVVGESLRALWTLQFDKKKIEVDLPLGPGSTFGKPLDKRREINLRWRHYTALLNRTRPPVPAQDLEIITGLATGSAPVTIPKLPTWRQDTKREMCSRTDADVHNISVRMIHRLYSSLLNRIPVLYQSKDGSWRANFGTSGAEGRLTKMFQRQSVIPKEDFDHVD